MISSFKNANAISFCKVGLRMERGESWVRNREKNLNKILIRSCTIDQSMLVIMRAW